MLTPKSKPRPGSERVATACFAMTQRQRIIQCTDREALDHLCNGEGRNHERGQMGRRFQVCIDLKPVGCETQQSLMLRSGYLTPSLNDECATLPRTSVVVNPWNLAYIHQANLKVHESHGIETAYPSHVGHRAYDPTPLPKAAQRPSRLVLLPSFILILADEAPRSDRRPRRLRRVSRHL